MKKLTLLALALLAVTPALATDVIIVGSGGDKEYRARFLDQGKRLRAVLVDKYSHPASTVHLLTEQSKPASNLAAIRALFADLTRRAKADEPLFVYLIGHGSYLRSQARFQIPGEDLSPEELSRLLAKVPNAGTAVVIGSSASAPFIEALSTKGRAICTATKSGNEQNATEFMGQLIESLEQGLADQDLDQRVNLYEAVGHAAAKTQAWYKDQGLIATEHALLDDNGDKQGTRLVEDPDQREPDTQKGPSDGAYAKTLYLLDFNFPKSAPKTLVAEYLAQMDKVRALIARKSQMKTESYWREFETQMTKAAKLQKEIRGYK